LRFRKLNERTLHDLHEFRYLFLLRASPRNDTRDDPGNLSPRHHTH
jgi:hypothetical protein